VVLTAGAHSRQRLLDAFKYAGVTLCHRNSIVPASACAGTCHSIFTRVLVYVVGNHGQIGRIRVGMSGGECLESGRVIGEAEDMDWARAVLICGSEAVQFSRAALHRDVLSAEGEVIPRVNWACGAHQDPFCPGHVVYEIHPLRSLRGVTHARHNDVESFGFEGWNEGVEGGA